MARAPRCTAEVYPAPPRRLSAPAGVMKLRAGAPTQFGSTGRREPSSSAAKQNILQHEAPQSGADVKNAWSYSSIRSYGLVLN